MTQPYRKKLIEVALPLEAINRESAREKSIRHGHPSTLHLWWARRPLASARAVIFGQLVDDPSAWPERFPDPAAQELERKRLFKIIEDMVPWEFSNDPRAIANARREIAQSWARSHPSLRAERIISGDATTADIDAFLANECPAIHDPFAGGGTIPLEAQRLGLRSIASDLNPVAVLINKALIELPPRFAGKPPINPGSRKAATAMQGRGKKQTTLAGTDRVWLGAQGLAEDVRYYGAWIRDEARKRIGRYYPELTITKEIARDRTDLTPFIGQSMPIIAWLWARTVPSPDPAVGGAHVPLVSTFWLSKKPGALAWLDPAISADRRQWEFKVRIGRPADELATSAGTKDGRGDFRCLLTSTPIPVEHIREAGKSQQIGQRMLAIALELPGGRAFVVPSLEQLTAATSAAPRNVPETRLPDRALGFRVQNYGIQFHKALFSARQLVAMETFSDLVHEATKIAATDAKVAGLSAVEADAYSDALALYLAFAVDKLAEGNSAQCTWSPLPTKLHVVSTFGRQALSMVWDFAEANIFGNSAGTIDRVVDNLAKVVEQLALIPGCTGEAVQLSATRENRMGTHVCTDPPYYDNIGYADLSDYFYIWLRRSLASNPVGRDLLSTILTPKEEEVIAEPGRANGDPNVARDRFETLLRQAFETLARSVRLDSVITIYYAFKQTETEQGEAGTKSSSTGWETMLAALIESGFSIVATWPVRTEKSGGYREMNRNALASSVVLACRRRPVDAGSATRTEFRRSLSSELPSAIRALQSGCIAPVDVAQVSIGPGMAIFTRYARVLEADGSTMTIRAALQLINDVLDQHLTDQEGELDSDSRFAVTWYENRAFDAGPYGEAETLAKARAVAVEGIAKAGILKSGGNKVRLLTRSELPDDWDPTKDTRLTTWEATQHLIKRLESHGEEAAAALLASLGSIADAARDLAYRLYSTCERKGWSEEARAYNGLVVAWPELERLAAKQKAVASSPGQAKLL